MNGFKRGVKFVKRNKKWFKLGKAVFEIITRHGHFRSYLKRMGIINYEGCFCGKEIEDVEHILFECAVNDEEWMEWVKSMKRTGLYVWIEKWNLIKNKEGFDIFEEYVDKVLSIRMAMLESRGIPASTLTGTETMSERSDDIG